MKKRFNTLVLTLVACYCLSILPMIFTGCANSSGGSGSGNENNSTASVSSVIGAAGGQVGNENASITIPAGALDSDTTITVKYLPKEEELTEGPMLGFAGAVEFGPSGTKFNSPAEVMVKLTQTPKNNALSIFCYDEENDRWQYESDAEIKNGYAKFEVNHFSKYRILDITPELLQKYMTIIKNNFDNGTPDTESRSQYLDYLLNTLKIMDTYELWGGQLYKCCGFIFSADYYFNGVEDDPNDLIYQYSDTSNKRLGSEEFYAENKETIVNGESTSQLSNSMLVRLTVYFKPVTTYEFSGHIKEEKEFDYEFYDYGYTHAMNVTPGKTKLIFDYDYTGFFFVEDGNLNGTIEYKNVKATAQTKSAYAHYQSGDSHNVTLLANAKFDCSDYSSNITGTCDDLNRCEINYDGYNKNIVEFVGSTDVTGAGPVLGGEHWTFTGDSVGYLAVGGKDNKALLSFYLLADETQENSLEDFKDSFYLAIEDELLVQDSNYTPSEMKLVSHKETTSQTITLKAVTEDD